MKESYGEGVASHAGPESCVGAREGDREALTGGGAGRVLSREMHEPLRGADAVEVSGRPYRARRQGEAWSDPRAVRDPAHVPKHREREPGEPAFVCGRGGRRPHREVQGHTPMMDERGQSDRPVVPGKPPNKVEEPAAEAVEGRGRAKGNSGERDALRTPGRAGALSALDRVRQADRKSTRLN